MGSLRIVVFGDVVGDCGMRVFSYALQEARKLYNPDLVIVNGENSASGFGITRANTAQFWELGVDVVTTGNHVWDKYETQEWIDSEPRVIRPLNYPPRTVGNGVIIVERMGMKIAVMNLMGRVFMDALDCPFRAADLELKRLTRAGIDLILVDMHAEATSEKAMMGYHLDGRVQAVWGTHTHVPTADERVLPGGTAFITDIGHCGVLNGMLGMQIGPSKRRMIDKLPARFTAESSGIMTATGILLEFDRTTKKMQAPMRLRYNLE